MLELEVSGSLVPVLSADGTWISLRTADGRPVLRYTDLYARDAAGELLAAWMRVEAGHIELHVDDATASYPLTIDPLVWTEQQKLTASIPEDGALFGSSVALSGETTLVDEEDVTTHDDPVLDDGQTYFYLAE